MQETISSGSSDKAELRPSLLCDPMANARLRSFLVAIRRVAHVLITSCAFRQMELLRGSRCRNRNPAMPFPRNGSAMSTNHTAMEKLFPMLGYSWTVYTLTREDDRVAAKWTVCCAPYLLTKYNLLANAIKPLRGYQVTSPRPSMSVNVCMCGYGRTRRS